MIDKKRSVNRQEVQLDTLTFSRRFSPVHFANDIESC